MKLIKEFNQFVEIDLLSDNSIEGLDNEIIMSLLFKYRNKDIGSKLKKIIDKFKYNKDWGYYNTPDDWFERKDYVTFMDYFKRKISVEKNDEIRSNTDNMMSLPCECNIESIGDLNDLSKVVRLKKRTDSVIEDLENIGVENTKGLSYINMKLLKVYYHRVHSPISGKIKDIKVVLPDDNFFGENNLWIVEIESEKVRVYLILVGELSIQDFDFKIKVGESVEMFDEIGNFNWASQVLILYDKTDFDKKIEISEDKKYFIGEKIF